MTALLRGLQHCATTLRDDVLSLGFTVRSGVEAGDAAYTLADAHGVTSTAAVLDAVCSGDVVVVAQARGASDGPDAADAGHNVAVTVEWVALRALLRSVVATLVHVRSLVGLPTVRRLRCVNVTCHARFAAGRSGDQPVQSTRSSRACRLL